MKKQLFIMRGLPGGGKSTWVQNNITSQLLGGARSIAICSTDDQFLNEGGEYVWDATKIAANHGANQRKAMAMMNAGVEVIYIDNTNTTYKEMRPYMDMAHRHGYHVDQILIGADEIFPGMNGNPHKFNDYIDLCARRNTHNVPRETIERMARRFEE